jgi:hypothetical protein
MRKLGDVSGWVAVCCWFLLFNIACFEVSNWFGHPTAIAGLGWTLAIFPLNSILILGPLSAICYLVAEKLNPDPSAPMDKAPG